MRSPGEINYLNTTKDRIEALVKFNFVTEQQDNLKQNMESKQFQKISNFFDTMPRLRHNVNFNCVSCSKDNSLVLEGLDSFFG